MLEDEGDVARRRLDLRDVVAADDDRARVGLLEPGDEAQRRRLAGAGRPEQHDELAVGDREIEVVDGGRPCRKRLVTPCERDLSHAAPPR